MKRDLFVKDPDLHLPARDAGVPGGAGVLRFVTCGSVDDGKSTLIGRLLYDSKALMADTLATLERHARERGLAAPDLALLTDGLIAEREQGITIDVAYRYFATPHRKFIIADSPGHEQYTRNMVTAASTADLAILLVDARKGLLPQTFRHAALVALLGVRRLVVAVNKMDLVDGSQAIFDAIATAFRQWLDSQVLPGGPPAGDGPDGAARERIAVDVLPISALGGDMIAERGSRLDWYRGPTLLRLLEAAPARSVQADAPLRFPVQWVCRPVDGGPRGYAGRIDAGRVSVGDEVGIWPSGARSRITQIRLGDRLLETAVAGQSVMLSFADERDVARGDLIVPSTDESASRSELTATLCWLSDRRLAAGKPYLLQHTTRAVRARVAAVDARLDVERLAWVAVPAGVGLNDIVRVRLQLQTPVRAEPFVSGRGTGRLLLVDPDTQATVAAGLID